jgi:hypothetical protein
MINEIRAGLITALKAMKTANGFTITLTEDHIYRIFDQNVMSSVEDAAYPKVFVLLDGGSSQPNVSSQRTTLSFMVTIVVKGTLGKTAQEIIEAVIDDMHRIIPAYHDLNRTCIDATIGDFTTDSGAMGGEEAAAVFRIDALYDSHRR